MLFCPSCDCLLSECIELICYIRVTFVLWLAHDGCRSCKDGEGNTIPEFDGTTNYYDHEGGYDGHEKCYDLCMGYIDTHNKECKALQYFMKESLETLRSRQDFAQRKRGSTSSKNILHTFYHRKLGKTYFTHCSKKTILVTKIQDTLLNRN